MTAATLTLSDFLLARIAEDQRKAKIAKHLFERPPGTPPGATYRTAATPQGMSIVAADHVLRWDPARVLAECDVKRRIVTLHEADESREGKCGACWDDCCQPCVTVRLLALPHADHPDYRPEWRP